ncbi:MAG: transglutaminase-like domain-containing protein [Mobilitalea sp.]
MSKQQKDGLYMESAVYMTDERKPGFPIQARIVQFLAILIGSWCFMGVFNYSIGLPVRQLFVDAAILISVLITFTLCVFPGMNLVKVFFGGGIYVLYLYAELDSLKNGFYILENNLLQRLSVYYGFNSIQYIADYMTAGEDCTRLLIMIAIPLVTCLSIAVVRNKAALIAGILLFLPITLCFAMGLIPPEHFLIAYLAVTLYISRSSFHTNKIYNNDQKQLLHRINSSAAIWLCVISLVAFFIIRLLLPKDQERAEQQINDTRNQIQTAMMNFSIEDVTDKMSDLKIFPKKYSNGGLSGGKLGTQGKIRYDYEEQLKITAPLSAMEYGVYLKGYVGAEYTGNSWDRYSSDTDRICTSILNQFPKDIFSPFNQVSQLFLSSKSSQLYVVTDQLKGGFTGSLMVMPFTAYSMSVEYKGANENYMYIPYFTDLSKNDNIKYVQDLYSQVKGNENSYQIQFYNMMDLYQMYLQYPEKVDLLGMLGSGLNGYGIYEDMYRDFVYQAYTVLPEQGLDMLKNEFSPQWMANPSNSEKMEKIIYIKDYLDQNTSYSLAPGKLPKGKDFVEYFLYENKIGYCAHYASAATLILRTMGIPARYVEGYAVGPEDVISSSNNEETEELSVSSTEYSKEVTVSVLDSNAHAWVEIYFDGVGWIPMDFTPALGPDLGTLGERENEVNPTPTTAPTLTPTPTTPPKEVIPTQAPPKQDPPKQAEKQEQVSKNTALAGILKSLLIIGGIVFLTIIIFYVYRKNKLNKLWNQNVKAIVLFTRMEKILMACHALGEKRNRLEDNEEFVKQNCPYVEEEEFSYCMEVVRRARFGKDRISAAELALVEQQHLKLYESAFRDLSLVKKLFLKLQLAPDIIA